MVQTERRLGDARDSGRRLEMADRGLSGSHDAWIVPASPCAERFAENGNLDRIPDSRSRAVRFDISHLVKRHLRLRVNLPDEGFLSVRIWRSDAVRAAVMIDGRPANYRVDLIVIRERRFKRF